MSSLTNNIRPNLKGDYPEIHSSALIDPSAQIIGKVIIGPNVFVAHSRSFGPMNRDRMEWSLRS
jgi:carbonic anhydrase/acetyltransferase-like protein (isoleucine patch superfamily)